MLRLDGDADVVVAAFFARQLERELIDLKQRILPQYLGRAERAENAKRMAEHERDEMLEKLRAATSMPCAPSATAALGELRWSLDNIGTSRDYFRIGNALESAIKALSPSATAVDHGYDRTASLNAGHYVCTCGGACSSPTTREQPK